MGKNQEDTAHMDVCIYIYKSKSVNSVNSHVFIIANFKLQNKCKNYITIC